MEKGNQSHEVRIWKRSPSNSFSTFLHCPPLWRFFKIGFLPNYPSIRFNTMDTLLLFMFSGSSEMDALHCICGAPPRVLHDPGGKVCQFEAHCSRRGVAPPQPSRLFSGQKVSSRLLLLYLYSRSHTLPSPTPPTAPSGLATRYRKFLVPQGDGPL